MTKVRTIVNVSVEIILRMIAMMAPLNRVAVPNIRMMDYKCVWFCRADFTKISSSHTKMLSQIYDARARERGHRHWECAEDVCVEAHIIN